MTITSKKLKKNNLATSLILNSHGVSRKEIAEYTGLDVRTASTHVAKLLHLGLVSEKKEYPEGKGRPFTKYYSNSHNSCYLGIHLAKNAIFFCMIDSDGKILTSGREDILLESETKLKTVNRIWGIMEKSAKELPVDKKICGIGIAVSRWLRPPLSSFDLYTDLTNILERETEIPVFVSIPINVLLYKERTHSPNEKDILLVHPGIVLELGVMKGGTIPRNADTLELSFSHICVEPEGIKCYCGKNGCLENYATRANMDEIFRKEATLRGEDTGSRFEDGLRVRSAAALAAAEKMSLLLARGIVCFAEENNIGLVEVLFPDVTFVEMTRKHVLELSKSGIDFQFRKSDSGNVVESAALMALFNVYKNFVSK